MRVSPESVYVSPHERAMIFSGIGHLSFSSSFADSPLLTTLFTSSVSVAEKGLFRSDYCDEGTCQFNFNMMHGANPSQESLTLSKEGSEDLVFTGMATWENKRVLRMHCAAQGTYTIRLSANYATVANPLFILSDNGYEDRIYSYSDNGSEITISC